MNKNLTIFLAAIAAGLTVVGVVSVNAQSKVSDPALVDVSVYRGATSCTGEATYLVAPVDAQLLSDLGAKTLLLQFRLPCARIDAIDGLLALPDSRSGKLVVQTQYAAMHMRQDGTCYATLGRTLAPVDADVAATVGTRSSQQAIDQIPCSRMAQVLVGAQALKGADKAWPVAVIALPLPLEP